MQKIAHKNVFEYEEKDFGAALEKLDIPLFAFDSTDDHLGGLKEIIEDSNLLLDDSEEFEDPSHDISINASNDLQPFRNSPNSPNSPSASRGMSVAVKRPRNKRRRRKRWCFKNAAYLFDSEVDITNRSCLHCGTRNTPLWREGPKGAGTLCNACGMRYKTGRLLPEYRPASSPGFKHNVHSNFHRKVMEIRREKNSPPNRNFSIEIRSRPYRKLDFY